ncbi:cytochrome-c peroxidase [Aestuariibaculum lutulentum]|uniref:Methylamine utilization protein n=1 Tax=Aestuariibaculum lutulentum TaxID=2920935 RepID=A0ABS9RJ47_9FLAO|nr:cytochrome c peroxidase [Aestuariibaculum lutulentum]MCH4552981.1 methylamine utilization protein [Aestuariibaculum lutulentum]
MKFIIKKEAYVFIGLFSLLFTSCLQEQKTAYLARDNNKNETLQKAFSNELISTIACLDSLSESDNIKASEKHYLNARLHFKKAEPVLAFVDSENYKFLNQPNILKVEEEDATDIKINNPTGFQVLEEEIFTETPDFKSITDHAVKTKIRLELIEKNLNFNYIKPYHVLWMIRDQIIRTALTGITGFDSPVLEQSLTEGQITYSALETYLSIYKDEFNDETLYKAWHEAIEKAISELTGDFNSFNRYAFIKSNTHKNLELWNKTVSDWKVKFPFTKAINNDAASLFSKNTFNLNHFSDYNDSLTSAKVALGKTLFFETELSASKSISCATCHIPEKGYTDGLAISKGVTRNSPTLLYAGLQKGFFYDNRAGSLEGQIVSVINNENEFHSDLKGFENAIKHNPEYIEAFKTAFNDSIKQDYIRHAIASFIRSLSPFNSKFDNNINDVENSLTASEINGFNLFTGKAKCATCHFAPLFNGTVPTTFKETEMELIGVPKTNDSINAQIDDDLGRYYLFHTPERKHFFKTTTVRNVAKTGPYMHNGVFKSLEEVLNFYNKGGGAGLGITLENQTLPPDALNLTTSEIQDIIAFLNSLTDQQDNNESI